VEVAVLATPSPVVTPHPWEEDSIVTVSLPENSPPRPFFEGLYGRRTGVHSRAVVGVGLVTGRVLRDHELAFVSLRLDYRESRGIVGVSEQWVERGNLLLAGTFLVDRLEEGELLDGVDGWPCRCIVVCRRVFRGERHSMARNGSLVCRDERGKVRDGRGWVDR